MTKKNLLVIIVIAAVIFGLGALTYSIMERRTESLILSQNHKDIQDFEGRNVLWSEPFPREYQSWKQTSDTTFRSKYMSSAADDVLEERPEMVILWAGYAFAKDYKAPRGHFYAVQDVRHTLRTGAPATDTTHGPQPATCWTCKSPDVPRMMQQIGIKEFYASSWAALGTDIVNPIGCADCHDPKTMNLTITRPALVEAFQRQGKDIRQVSHQQMRSLVCAQCHVEYYFKGKGKYLTLPWDKGMNAEEMEAYYDQSKHVDFVHKLSRTPILKAQHPDFEIFQKGIHAQRGVSCADCHMPYRSEGGIKYTDHHIISPLKEVNHSCQVCHRESEETLIRNVYDRQDAVFTLRNRLEKQLAKVHFMAKYAWDNQAKDSEMQPILSFIRKSQWRWDYITASHGASFHAPLESLRVLADGMQYALNAEMAIQDLYHRKNIRGFVLPDISTKAKAQKVIGIDMEKEVRDKQRFLQERVPEWLEKAVNKGVLVSEK